MSIRVSAAHFSGTSKLFGRDPDHLAAIIRGLVVDMTQVKIDAADVGSFTDNSTGTAAAALVDLVVPTEPFDASAVGGAQLTSFDTAMGKIEDALAVLAQKLNLVRAVLGLDAIGYDGTVAVAGTIAALDKTITAATGASTVSFATGSDRMALVRLGLQRLIFAWNETMTAAGFPLLANLAGPFAPRHWSSRRSPRPRRAPMRSPRLQPMPFSPPPRTTSPPWLLPSTARPCSASRCASSPPEPNSSDPREAKACLDF